MSMMSQMMGSMQMSDMGMRMDMDKMQECMEACSAAAQAATMCADACAGDDMMRCMAMCANMADMASTMMRVMMRPNGYDMESMSAVMQACMTMGTACAEECRRHADMQDHCRICAAACERMVEACREMMGSMSSMGA